MGKIDMGADPSLAVVAQAVNDHLEDCYAARREGNRRLARIEGILISVAGFLLVQMLGVTFWLLTHPAALPHVATP